VRAVGPVTDFSQLVCDSIRQFLLHKQQRRQQQQQQQQQQQEGRQVQTAVPWRRPRDFVAQTTVVAGSQRKPTSPNPDQVPETPDVASPVADDRNMFQRYHFQFDSIGNFGRRGSAASNVATPTATTGTGSWEKQVRCIESGSTAPIAVFRFHDFDDMVARMRDQSAPQTSGQCYITLLNTVSQGLTFSKDFLGKS